MQGKVVVAAASVAGLAAGAWLFRRWWKYGVLFSPIFTQDGVVVYKQKPPRKVYFGKVEGEDRGPNPMDPPIVREDPLFWLRDDKRKDRRVISHLNRENAYFDSEFKPLEQLQDDIYKEFLSHMKETDEEVPYPYGAFFYYTRTVKGLSYRIHCRKAAVAGAPSGPEQIVLDINALGKGKSYCDVQEVNPSPDHTVVAITVDYTGYETYEVLLRDIATGKTINDKIKETAGQLVWGSTKKEFFYTTQDAQHRPYKVWRHIVGQPQSSDECLFTEDDGLFWVHIQKSDSGRFFYVYSGSSTRTEVWIMDLEAGAKELSVVQPREEDHLYQVEHWGDDLYIITNCDGCINSKLMKTPLTKLGRANWKEVHPYEKTTKLDYLVCFEKFIVINGRSNGLKMCKIMNMQKGSVEEMKFDEECFDVYGKTNKEFKSTMFRFGYSSMVTPPQTMDYNMQTKEKILLKEQEVPNYDRNLYTCERTFATAADGYTKIPICMVYRKDSKWATKKQACPTMLYGYGSYGICVDPSFNFKDISYLDRGMIFAIANIRGGGEMGREWYEKEGKYLEKMNTFTDFRDCALHLIAKGYTTPDQLACSGRSAGGMLMGGTVNLCPELFKVSVAGVPFVDVMTTMCDPSIPLTIGEWEEWGNPNEKKYFDYMLQYSPVDNVKPRAYPNVLVTAGLNDPRVAYWEPAKWVALLRENNTNKDSKILMKIDMSAGHFAASDRYRLLKERSIEYAFVTSCLGCTSIS